MAFYGHIINQFFTSWTLRPDSRILFSSKKNSIKAMERLHNMLGISVHRVSEVSRLDQETSFISAELRTNAEDLGIDVQFSGIEAHNYIRQVELYQHPLRFIFHIIRTSHPSFDNHTTLGLSIKAMNETMGRNGLVPSLLVVVTMLLSLLHL